MAVDPEGATTAPSADSATSPALEAASATQADAGGYPTTSESAPAPTPAAAPAPKAAAQPKPALRTGQRVILQGLENKRELNGHRGVVIKWKPDAGRYAVRVAGKEMGLKPENLKVEGGRAEAENFMKKHANTKGLMFNPVVAYKNIPGAGPKMTQWIGQVKAGTRRMVRAESSVGLEDEPIPLWYGDHGFVRTSPVDVALLVSDVGPDPEEWPQALSRVLERFPAAAGRLRQARKNKQSERSDYIWQIVLNNAGVPFTLASVPPCSLPSPEDLQKLCCDDKNDFFDFGPADGSESGDHEPLLRFKLITEEGTAKGILGISFNHALCDVAGLGLLLKWLHSEVDSMERAPAEGPCDLRGLADETLKAVPEASAEDATAYETFWPLWPRALERWSFMARRLRAALRGRPDGVASVHFSVPPSGLAALKSEAEADGAAGASAFEALISYIGMKLARLGRNGRRCLITKDYRAGLAAAAPGNGLEQLFANAVTHGLSFEVPEVSTATEMPLGEACKAMHAAIEAASLGYVAWHREQDHFRGLPNFFSGLCCNSWGRALADVGFVEAYAIGMRSVDERAATMCFPLDTAYMQVFPQPSGSHLVVMTMPVSDLTSLLKELPAEHFNVPHLSEVRAHPFKVPLPPTMLDKLNPAVEELSKYVRIACVGDSITACGYPKYLQAMFDKADLRTQIRNFGVQGTTAQKFADHPYWDEKKLEDARQWRPHFVISSFGTNDAKESNWDVEAFEQDYRDLLKEFLERLHPRPICLLLTPPPVYEAEAYEIQQDVVNNELPTVIPRISQATERLINEPLEAEEKRCRQTIPDEFKAHLDVLDVFDSLGGSSLRRRGYFAEDGVHPNERGTRLLATVVFARIRRQVQAILDKWRDAPKVVDDGGLF